MENVRLFIVLKVTVQQPVTVFLFFLPFLLTREFLLNIAVLLNLPSCLRFK